ncbi:MAG: PAS domain S-box protein [Ectothiorhodospiraceae bacterium]|nr:PAS domain S-box protein [Ectothiorhodospiraceae bacterium]
MDQDPALSHQRALLDFAVSHSAVVFYVASLADGQPLRYISANVETITGHPQRAFLDDPGYGRALVHPDDVDACDHALATLRRDGEATRCYRFRRADGSWRWYRDQLRLIDAESPTDEPRFAASMTDVTAEVESAERETASLAALRDSETRFRGIVEITPACIHELDLEGRVESMNPAGLRLVGVDDIARIRGADYLDFVAAEDRPRARAAIARARAGERVQLEFRAADPEPRWFLTIKTPLTDATGSVRRLLGITIEVTDRRLRETDLRRANETLEDAIESLSEGFALFGADHRLIMCNRQFRDMNTASADKLEPGTRWIDFIRAGAERGQYVDAVGRVEQWLAACIDRGDPSAGLEFQQSDGRWFESLHRRTRQGGTVVVRTEVTRRKTMERALRASEALVRRILEACPVPIGMTRADDGLVIYESPASRALFGRDAASGPVHTRDFFADPSDRDRYLARLRRRGTVDGHEVRLRRSDGTRFWAAISARLVEYQGEEVIVSSTFDLTERMQVEAEMARSREALHQSEKMSALGELLASVSHELNNPLSVLVGQALLLRESAADPEVAGRATKIGNAAERCARIVRTFLAMARQRPSQGGPVDVNAVIESALGATADALRASGITLRRHLAADLPRVWADADQLGQVVANLVMNAEDALAQRAEGRELVVVSAYRPSDEVVIEVRDNGPGVPREIRSRIFEPFFTTKDVAAGTGIGLALCHRIIDGHGGVLEVEDVADGGAAFVIRLPPMADAALGADGRDAAGTPPGLRVLVVDDEHDVSEMLGEILREEGHEVLVASDGGEALDALAAREFDVVLSDLRMPGLDGPALYRRLADERPALAARTAFITGDTMSERLDRFLADSGRPCIDKPFSPSEVRAVVRELARQSAPGG